jgi:hypothetical protein
MNIVLDLDGTLGSEDCEWGGTPTARPFLEPFLGFCFKEFQTVSIWTAAPLTWVSVYRKDVFPAAYPFSLIFTEDHCDQKYRKPLRKLWKFAGFSKHNTIIVDNTSKTYQQNYGNAIPIKTYQGPTTNPNDNELLILINYLKQLMRMYDHLGTIRFIEKRYWSQDYKEESLISIS